MYNQTRNTFTKDDLFPKFYNQCVFETFPNQFLYWDFFPGPIFSIPRPSKDGHKYPSTLGNLTVKTSHSVYKILHYGWSFKMKIIVTAPFCDECRSKTDIHLKLRSSLSGRQPTLVPPPGIRFLFNSNSLSEGGGIYAEKGLSIEMLTKGLRLVDKECHRLAIFSDTHHNYCQIVKLKSWHKNWPYTAHRAVVRSVSSYWWCMVLHGIA